MQIFKRKLSTKDIINILESGEKVDKIVCSQGTYNHLPKKALKSLRKMGVEIEVVNLKRGKKPVVDVGGIKNLVNLPAKQISKQLKIPLRTVYYHLKRFKRRYGS